MHRPRVRAAASRWTNDSDRFRDDDDAYDAYDGRRYRERDVDERELARRARERAGERSGGFRIIERGGGGGAADADARADRWREGESERWGAAFERNEGRDVPRRGGSTRGDGTRGRGMGGRARGRGDGGRGARRDEGGRGARREDYSSERSRGYGSERSEYEGESVDDDDWLLLGLEDELEDGRRWGERNARGYLPELLSKYVEDDFEATVYTREPDDLDEYTFFSGARFAQLGASDEVRTALRESFKIERPSHIQAQSYRALSGVDANSSTQHILLADQAGSGKTLAYLLPLLQRLQIVEAEKGRSKPRRPRLLVLTPTSELATQVRDVVKQLSFGGLRSRSLLANNVSKPRTQIEALMDGVDIVVGTPGRVARLIEEGKMLTDDVEAVVLDECDVLLGESFEFAEQVAPIRNAVKPGTQFVLVTATIPDEVLRQLKRFFESDIRVVQGPGLHRPSAGMLERLIDCSGGDVFDEESGFYRKFKALLDLLEVDRANRALLFCNKIETCRKVENFLTRADRDGEKYKILPYHAALSREQQQKNLKEFITSPSKTPHILVCTDRASRGLDASRVEHVILFDFPRDPSEYVRRVGRTARGAMGQGRVSVLVIGKQVRLAREIMRRNDRGDPVEATPTVS